MIYFTWWILEYKSNYPLISPSSAVIIVVIIIIIIIGSFQ